MMQAVATFLLTTVLWAKMPTPGEAPPSFELPLSGGKGVVRLEDFRGKVVLVDFWATWCPPCRETVPHLVDLQRRYASKGLQVVGVSVDRDGDRVVRPFMDKYQVNYKVALDNGTVADNYRVNLLPMAFLIGKDGRLIKRYAGFTAPKDLEKDITEQLKINHAATAS